MNLLAWTKRVPFRKKKTFNILKKAHHGIDKESISPGARAVVKTLQSAGYEAFVVGGAIRDLLLGHTPKDFDVATNAKPEEVKALFKRAIIIGKRFKLVHVRINQEIIEVSTFRQAFDANAHGVVIKNGRILQDNAYGTQEEDVLRRDFTINALYYHVDREEIWDFCQGFESLRKRQLKVIGDPLERFCEDPVRMLRAIRLSAKLDLALDPEIKAIVLANRHLLSEVPKARLFDELLKCLLGGFAKPIMATLAQYGFLEILVPSCAQTPLPAWIDLVLEQTDQRFAEGKTVSPSFTMAALLWPALLANANLLQQEGMSLLQSFEVASQHVLQAQLNATEMSRNIMLGIRDIVWMQPRFLLKKAKVARSLAFHPRLRGGFDFLALRAMAGEISQEWVDFWRPLVESDAAGRDAFVQSLAKAKKTRKRKS
jgi:poly(A) polymerase